MPPETRKTSVSTWYSEADRASQQIDNAGDLKSQTGQTPIQRSRQLLEALADLHDSFRSIPDATAHSEEGNVVMLFDVDDIYRKKPKPLAIRQSTIIDLS